MKSLKFKCDLQSDIILSEFAATEGMQRTLDYIPGNVFLGIVASKVYNSKVNQNLTMDLFHNSKVRFGDALPFIVNKRAIRVPSTWFVKKGETIRHKIYIFPQMMLGKGSSIPYTQLREQFIVNESDSHFSEVNLKKNFAIKSSYDRNRRRSMDEQMYGYQSLEAGLELCFQVDLIGLSELELPKIENIIQENLLGNQNIGRSKTAQYGLVKITQIKEDEINLGFKENHCLDIDKTFLYAESRLLFIDEINGQPIIPTSGNYYGISEANVDFENSQIRTFRYSPYNSKRQVRDADRFGIEKGSVICINRKIKQEEQLFIKRGIGYYLNEGYGKVLINPDFIAHKENGEAEYSYNNDKQIINPKPIIKKVEFSNKSDAVVWRYLVNQETKKNNQHFIYTKVNEFVNDHLHRFKGDSFASQWSTIRTIASQTKEYDQLWKMLFKENKQVSENEDKNNEGYLVHGVAKNKWKERSRIEVLKLFITTIKDNKMELVSEAVINLAAEMAKKTGGN